MAVRIDYSISMRHPILDGRAQRAAGQYADDVQLEIARHTERMVQRQLRAVLRNPTGYYQSNITLERGAGDAWVVHDGGVVYGPWLEGVGSRNSPVTRFPGYATFRRTKALVLRQAPQIAQRAMRRYRGRFG